ncbi:hypothetical protein GEMRC1_013048 [Eukaryota sp. GEM-RC1]
MSISIDQVLFSSDFDSGNLANVIQTDHCQYRITAASDAYSLSSKSWFFFSVQGLLPDKRVTFTLENPSNHANLYKQDFRPVHSCQECQSPYDRIDSHVLFKSRNKSITHLSFSHHIKCPPSHTHFFAWTYPYPFSKIQQLYSSISPTISPLVSFQEEIIGESLDGHPVTILTVTKRHQSSQVKPIIFVTARVHPGETSASFMLEGFLRAILSDSTHADVIRSLFEIKICPCLNPDGVFRGHYRMDKLGVNLNRFYDFPNKDRHPTIWYLKDYIENLSKISKIAMFIDLHAHASRRGVFMFGNRLSNDELQIQNMLFGKIFSNNSKYFDYRQCMFSSKGMTAKDKQGLSKQGSSRVALFKKFGIIHCYTLESNPNNGHVFNQIFPLETDQITRSTIQNDSHYNPTVWCSIGEAMMHSILDLFCVSPSSRLKKENCNTLLNLIDGIRAELRVEGHKRGSKIKKRKQLRDDESSLLKSSSSSSLSTNSAADAQNSDDESDEERLELHMPTENELIRNLIEVYQIVWQSALDLKILTRENFVNILGIRHSARNLKSFPLFQLSPVLHNLILPSTFSVPTLPKVPRNLKISKRNSRPSQRQAIVQKELSSLEIKLPKI